MKALTQRENKTKKKDEKIFKKIQLNYLFNEEGRMKVTSDDDHKKTNNKGFSRKRWSVIFIK